MKKISIFIIFILSCLVGCGGGGGGGSTTVYSTTTLKVSLSGTLPAGTAIISAGFTLTLPANVTPAMVNGAVASSVVTPSGTFAGGTALPPIYTLATATTAGTLRVVLANASPAGVTQVGEISTVVLQLANGAAPTASAFTLSAVDVRDTFGILVSGMQALVSGVTLQ